MSLKEQTITFAAICHCAQLVQNIARKNQCDQQIFDVMMNSIVNINPANTIDVYGGKIANLSDGLLAMTAQLGDSTATKDPEVTRYIVSLMNLERRLKRNPKVMAQLGQRIEDCERQLEHFDIDSDHMHSALASIYTDIISPLSAKIQIAGDPNILKQVGNQNRIRALLLAGVRATVLWRQVGGKRRHVLFNRRKFVATAQTIMKQI